MWDQSRALEPWLNRLISNQLKNILRNYYSNFARPCLNCPFAIDAQANSCAFTPSGNQDSACPLFAKWERTKKDAYNIKIPLSLSADGFTPLNFASTTKDLDIEKAIHKLSGLLKKELTKKQYEVFNLLYVQNFTDEEVAERMGYTTTEKNRKLGYKQMKNIKRVIRDKTKALLEKKDVFY